MSATKRRRSVSSEGNHLQIDGEGGMSPTRLSFLSTGYAPTETSHPGERMEAADSQIVGGFLEKNQELIILTRKRTSSLQIDVKDLQNFAFELQDFHLKSAEEVATSIGTRLSSGLSASEATKRLERFGPNVMKEKKDWPIVIQFIISMFSGFGCLLWAATILAFLSWQPFAPDNPYNLAMAVLLALINALSASFTFYQEKKASKVMSGFQKMVAQDCMVVRGGATIKIGTNELTVGDLVLLETGYRVPADLRLVSCSNLRLDKSMLTGEVEPVRAVAAPADASCSFLESPNVAFMGCNILEGQGVGMVIAVGQETQLAKIMHGVNSQETETSTLQQEINRVVVFIATAAIITSTTVVLVWRFFLYVEHREFMSMATMIANNIGVVVAYCPDGLPLALAMGLALISRRLCKKYNVLVKKLGMVETVGSMSLLASDKTGTLTENNMTVTGLLSASTVEAMRAGTAAEAAIATTDGNDSHVVQRARCAAELCNQALLEESVVPTVAADGSAVSTVVKVASGSNATDRALLNWSYKMSAAESEAANAAAPPQTELLAMVPFSSTTKMQAVVVRYLATYETFVFVKGAPEFVLKSCVSYLTATGETAPINSEFLANLNVAIEQASATGKRIVALAQLGALSKTDYPATYLYETEPRPNFPMTGLTFIACAAISDPPKATSRAAVEALRCAGISVAMVTGDAAPTAVAIARAVGIVTAQEVRDMRAFDPARTIPEAGARKGVGSETDGAIELTQVKVGAHFDIEGGVQPTPDRPTSNGDSKKGDVRAVLITGKDIDSMTVEGWDFIFQHQELVFARTTPEHKLQVVKEAKSRGHRVGVTGDGVNDSPALKCADVGIAMSNGSDVARDSAAIVLLSNDLAAVPVAVREGRLLFENLRKVIAYLLTAGSWAEALPVLATFFLGMPQPLSAFLMIIICCFTDVFGGVALVNEAPEHNIMHRPPRNVKELRLLDFKLLLYSYMFYANLMSVGAFFNYFHYMYHRGPAHLPTPLPVDDDGQRTFPAGYTSAQLIGAWNWAVNNNALGEDMVKAANVGSSVFFVALVVGQFGHLLSVRRKIPYFHEPIMKIGAYEHDDRPVHLRVWAEICTIPATFPTHILVACIAAAVVAIAMTEGPLFQQYCETGSVPPLYWGMAFGWSALWFTLGEVRKWIIVLFPKSWFAWLAW